MASDGVAEACSVNGAILVAEAVPAAIGVCLPETISSRDAGVAAATLHIELACTLTRRDIAWGIHDSLARNVAVAGKARVLAGARAQGILEESSQACLASCTGLEERRTCMRVWVKRKVEQYHQQQNHANRTCPK